MAPVNPHDPDADDPGAFDQTPFGQEPPEVEDDAPRRAASARFIVDAEIGSSAALRGAMDPANQSLADALRLSYRILQFVIMVLIVLFLASGFQTVADGQTGVLTVFGKIVPYGDDLALSPGPKFSYPQPVGEFVVFDAENRSVDLGIAFAPDLRGRARAEMIEGADLGAKLTPGQGGSLITRDGDLAHMEIAATFVIEGPVDFVNHVADAERTRDAAKIVKLALQNATICVTAKLSLDEISEYKATTDEARSMIQAGTNDARARIMGGAQQMLDELKCGIKLQTVTLQAYAPLAIEKTKGDVAAASAAAAEAISEANKKKTETLSKIAGAKYDDLIRKIEEYEKALDSGDEAESARLLTSINEYMESGEITGEVSSIINFAKSYQSQIDSTLGIDAKRFNSLLPEFRKNPHMVANQLWLEAYAKVTGHRDTEIMYVPAGIQSIMLSLNGSAEIADIRNKARMAQKQGSQYKGLDPTMGYISRGADMTQGPGRQVEVGPDGKVKPKGGPL